MRGSCSTPPRRPYNCGLHLERGRGVIVASPREPHQHTVQTIDDLDLRLSLSFSPFRVMKKHVSCRWFGDWTSAANFLRDERECDLCGIVSPAAPATSPEKGDTPAVFAPSIVEGGVLAKINIGHGEAVDTASAAPSEKLQSEHASKSDAGSEGARQQRFVDESRGRGCQASIAVRHRPFRRSTAFLVGHRNRLEDTALEICDFFVHVEQAKDSPVALEPPVTTAIALHHFTAWAHYEERTFAGEKFQLNDQPVRCRPPSGQNALAEKRLRAREELREADPFKADEGPGNYEHQRRGAGLGLLAEDEGICEDECDY